MKYEIKFKRCAVKDLKKLSEKDANKVVERVEYMRNDLKGDVKRLTNFTP